MDIHKNARLTPHSRAELVRRVLEEGQPRDSEPVGPFAPMAGLVDQGFSDVEDDTAKRHDFSPRSSRVRRFSAGAKTSIADLFRVRIWRKSGNPAVASGLPAIPRRGA